MVGAKWGLAAVPPVGVQGAEPPEAEVVMYSV